MAWWPWLRVRMRSLPNTQRRADCARAIQAGPMLRRYRAILSDRCFLTHALMMSFCSFSLFAYLGGSPVTFITHYHFTPGQFAIGFGLVAATFIAASQLNMRVIRRFELDGTLRLASTLYLVLNLILVGAGAGGRGGTLDAAVPGADAGADRLHLPDRPRWARCAITAPMPAPPRR